MTRRFVRLGIVLVLISGPGLYLSAEKRVTLVVGGVRADVRTVSFTVGQMLARRGIRVGPEDLVFPSPGSRLRDGLRVTVQRAPDLTLVVNGRVDVVPVPFDSSSIREALAWARIPLYPDDIVTPNLDVVPRHGMTVRITRVTTRDVSTVEEIPFATSTRYDPDMRMGTSRVLRAGRAGSELVTYRVRLEDGRPVGREVVSTLTIERPQTEYVEVGTNSRERQATWQQGQSSWYERPGVGAAHRWLPKGTKVTVTNLDTGASITVIIDDRGPYGVAGRILDLSKEAFAQLAPLGQGVFPVQIDW
jgi:uncharacterized protein YabE (DUF348 family)